jgi:hypothetical protein
MTPIIQAVLALLLLPIAALGWTGAGHQVIAAEAYRTLPASRQKKAAQLLQAHPQYERWKAALSQEAGGPDKDLELFMRASTWADEVRRRDTQYNHPKWHYIDYPLRPSKFPVLPDASPSDNILSGIDQCEKVLSDRKASPEQRAVSLAWLIHLIGDLHQPLHCESLFTAAYPVGDKGGNNFFVRPAEQGISLHHLWDGLLGTSGKPQSRLNYAIGIQTRFPRKSLKELRKATSPKEWSLESRSVAIDKAYLRGKLQGSTSPEAAPSLPRGYSKEAKAVAERQGALAGYRLADEIQSCLK